ncbi:hypothetical protein CN907_19630 [Bacillus anthracis]|nr:hypothetical protein CN907_19630 [Bacillus anthracis]
MFKKLIVGALAAGIALTGGIGAASASAAGFDYDSNHDSCYNSDIIFKDGKYTKYILQDNRIFDNSYTDYQGITWYFKDWDWSFKCGKYVGLYEGRMYNN